MYHSQYKQDYYLHTNIFKDYKDGYFVDVGAHDGVTINNTLFFDQEMGWKGINIEPIETVYKGLVKFRPRCININCAISNYTGTAKFINGIGYTEMISGLLDSYHSKHADRILSETKIFNSQIKIILVDVKELKDILNKYNIKRVNYLYIDVEGAEEKVLRSIDFDQVFIDVIGVEMAYDDTNKLILSYLKEKDYLILNYVGMDKILIHKNSSFLTEDVKKLIVE